MRAWVSCALLAMTASCLRTVEYKCSSNAQCDPDGTCEANGFCSFPDSMCADGRRFGSSAGSASGKCVGEVGGDIDAAIDMPGIDGGIDMSTGSCPGTYTADGTTSYRYVATAADWLTAEMDCEDDGTGTHLVVAADAGELTKIDAMSSASQTWIGSSDRVNENTFLWVTGASTAKPANNSGANDCTNYYDGTSGGTAGASVRSCAETHVYVCECDGTAAMASSYTP